MKQNLRQAMSSATTEDSDAADEEQGSSSTQFRFLDLPPEIRAMIYQYYYASSDLVFKCSRKAPESWSHSLNWGMQTEFSGLPESSLHQVSLLLAKEATPIWNCRISDLTIILLDVRCGALALFASCSKPGLKCRLVTLKILAEQEDVMTDAWDALVKSCPNLRNVEVTDMAVDCPEEWDIPIDQATAEELVCEAMNMSSDETANMLQNCRLSEIVKAFELNSRQGYNIIGSSHLLFENWDDGPNYLAQSSSRRDANGENDNNGIDIESYCDESWHVCESVSPSLPHPFSHSDSQTDTDSGSQAQI